MHGKYFIFAFKCLNCFHQLQAIYNFFSPTFTQFTVASIENMFDISVKNLFVRKFIEKTGHKPSYMYNIHLLPDFVSSLLVV